MIAWSTVSMEAEEEESNLGFLLRPAYLQKYLDFSGHRCTGMANIPDVLFPPKKKGKAEGSTRRTRSKRPSPVLVKEAEPSGSSDDGSISLSSSEEGDSAGDHAPQITEGPSILDDSTHEDEDEIPLVTRTHVLKRRVAEPSEDADPSSFPKEGEAESHEYVEFIKMYPPMKKARSVNVLFADESSGPLTEAVPPIGGDGESVALLSFPSSTSAVEPATGEVRIEPIAALEGLESEANTTEAAPISKIENVVVAVDQEETKPVTAGTLSVAEIASLEVRDPLEVQNEPELPDSGVPNQEEIEPVIAGTSSGAEVTALEVQDPLEVQNEPELPDLEVGEATSTSSLAWWGTVGSQEDPVLGLRHRIEVRSTVTVIHFGSSEIWIAC
jgi:hypothetical protein